jgi:hypothetical protein
MRNEPKFYYESHLKIRWAASLQEWKNFLKSAARWTLNRVEVIT